MRANARESGHDGVAHERVDADRAIHGGHERERREPACVLGGRPRIVERGELPFGHLVEQTRHLEGTQARLVDDLIGEPIDERIDDVAALEQIQVTLVGTEVRGEREGEGMAARDPHDHVARGGGDAALREELARLGGVEGPEVDRACSLLPRGIAAPARGRRAPAGEDEARPRGEGRPELLAHPLVDALEQVDVIDEDDERIRGEPLAQPLEARMAAERVCERADEGLRERTRRLRCEPDVLHARLATLIAELLEQRRLADARRSVDEQELDRAPAGEHLLEERRLRAASDERGVARLERGEVAAGRGLHRGDELVAHARHGAHVRRRLRIVSEGPTQAVERRREDVRHHGLPRPDGLEQLGLRHDAVAVLHEVEQHVEDPWLYGDARAGSTELAPPQIQLDLADVKDTRAPHGR